MRMVTGFKYNDKTLMIKLYRCPNPQLKLKCPTTLKLNVYMIVKTDKNKD